MLKLATKQSIAVVEQQKAAELAINNFKISRQAALDSSVVTTIAGNQYDADERSISRMANALLAMEQKPSSYIVHWSMVNTETGVMTPTAKADLAEAHRLAVENMAAIWGAIIMYPIKTEKIGKRRWRLLEPWRDIPAGFESDGASVPRFFWWFMDPATEAFEAAIIHDHALRAKKPYAHQLFYNALIEYQVPKWRALIAFVAVRLWSVL